MRLGDSIVVTPMDNPGQYDPDWRNFVARGAMEMDPGDRIDPLYASYFHDPWVKRQMSYLKAMERGGPFTPAHVRLRMVDSWFQGNEVADVRFRLEPLLLTAAPYKTIALDILGDDSAESVDAIEAYEKLYFNIRDKDGRLSRSCQLRQYFALPSGRFNKDTPPEQLWKMIGSLMGYDTLMAVWMWHGHGLVNDSQEYLLDEMWRLAQSRLFMSMFADRVGHESMSKLLTAISGQQKMIRESKAAGSNADVDMVRAMQGMLGLVSPVLIGAVAADVDRAKAVEASEARMRIESAVDAVELEKTGANGVELIPVAPGMEPMEPTGGSQ